MCSFKNVGELVIPSNESPSIDWRIPELNSVIDYKINCTFESPPFRFKAEELKITFLVNVQQNWCQVQVVRADDTSFLTNLVHKRGIKKADNSVYICIDTKQRKGICPWNLATIRSTCIGSLFLTIFVEFTLSNSNTECELSLPSIPLESLKCFPPPCKECGHVDKNGQDILTKNLKELYINELYWDFIINIGERKFKTHRAILAAQSKVFAAMMKHDMAEKKNNEMDINDCDPDAFHEFLLYLYSGKVEKFSDGSIVAVYAIADKYSVGDLKAECINFMKNNLSVDMFCSFIELAVNHKETELLKLSKEYFTSNAKQILLSANWQTFLIQNSTLANELFLLMVPSN